MSATTEVEAGAEVQSLLDQSQWTGKIYSDGWVDAPVQIETTEPATGEVLGTAGGGDPETIARAASSAAAAQRAWAETPFADRVAVVRRAAELMESHRAELDPLAHPRVRRDPAQGRPRDHGLDRPAPDRGARLVDQPLDVELPSLTPGRTSTARRDPARRRRRDHALELPLRARHALGRPGARARQRRRAQAGRQHAGHRRRRDRAALRGGRAARRRAARAPGRRRGRATPSSPTPTCA